MKRAIEKDGALMLNALIHHHKATKGKDVTLLKKNFVADALFVGTDDTEQWTLEKYVQALESSVEGWDMTSCTERSVYQVGENYGAFFEVVVHHKYGLMRGSGILVKCNDECWRIQHYVLSFSVPNHVVDQTNILELLAR